MGGGSQTGVGGGVNGGAEMEVVTHSFKRRGSTRSQALRGARRSQTLHSAGRMRGGGRVYF